MMSRDRLSLSMQQISFAEAACGRLGDPLPHELKVELSDGRFSAHVGMDVYRNNMASTWRNALATTYPILEQLIGKGGFTLLVRDYLQLHPSINGDLNQLGGWLFEFLPTYVPLLDYPFLSAVALLEWHIHTSHDAANHVPLSVADVMAHGVDEWMKSTVGCAPSAFVLRMPYAAGTIWLAHQTGGNVSALKPDNIMHSEHVLVSRPQWRVEVALLSEAECRLLELLHGGATFEGAFEALDAASLTLDFTAFLSRCLAAGVWCQRV